MSDSPGRAYVQVSSGSLRAPSIAQVLLSDGGVQSLILYACGLVLVFLFLLLAALSLALLHAPAHSWDALYRWSVFTPPPITDPHQQTRWKDERLLLSALPLHLRGAELLLEHASDASTHAFEETHILLSPSSSPSLPYHPSSFLPSLHYNPVRLGHPLLSTDPAFDALAFASFLADFGFSADPLPACSVLNVHLTMNLLEFVRHVQAPHLWADCVGLRTDEQRRCVNSLHVLQRQHSPAPRPPHHPAANRSELLHPRWLEFEVDDGSAHGLVDRFKGLTSALLMALLTQRAFAIDWLHNPAPLTSILLPSVLPWVEHSGIDGSRAGIGEPSRAFVHRRFVLQPASERMPEWYDRQSSAVEYMRVNHKMTVLQQLSNSSAFQQRLQRLGFNLSEDTDVYFGCLWQFLFRPSRRLADTLQPALQATVRQPVHRAFPWPHNDTAELRSQLASDTQPAQLSGATLQPANSGGSGQLQQRPTPLLFCLQVRMGSAGTAGHGVKDWEPFLTNSSFSTLFTHARQLLDRSTLPSTTASPTPPVALFVAADSDEVLPYIPLHFPPSQFSYVDFPGVVYHIDNWHHQAPSLSERVVGLTKVAASWYLLGECDGVVVSPSAFGAVALWRTARRWGRGGLEGDGRVWAHAWRTNLTGHLHPFYHDNPEGRG